MTNLARLFACLATMSLVAVGAASAQDAASSHASSPTGSPATDIKVHGHWVIEIRNSDGSLSSHNEFENACMECGKVITALLARQPGNWLWDVRLQPDVNGTGACKNFDGTADLCTVVEASMGDFGFPEKFFPTLTLSPDLLTGTLELNGHFTASFAGQVASVAADINSLTSFPPITWTFSARLLAAPLQVVAGQQVYVKVTFSFS